MRVVQIFVTVGTSALDLVDGKTSQEIIQDLNEFPETCFDQYKKDVVDALNNRLAGYREDETNYQDFSAEWGSLLAMKNSEGLLSGTLGSKRIILLHSETSEGRLCSKALEETIKGAQGDAQLVDPTVKDCVQSRQIDGIKVNDPEAFKTNGLDNLQKIVQEFCGEPVAGNQPPPNLRFFNMTGGYKGLIPYATILAWDYAMSLCYLYDEESDRLIELPRPVKDWRPIYAEVVNQTGISAKEKYRGKSLA